jgi:hypothetical protein
MRKWLIGLVVLVVSAIVFPSLVGLLAFVVIFVLPWLVLMKFVLKGFTFGTKTKHYSSVPGADQIVHRFKENSDNPWEKRIEESPLYGMVPNNKVELMKRVSADPNEKVISAIWVWHGWTKQGYLVITSNYLRWIQTFPSASQDLFFQLNSIIDKYDDGALNYAPIIGSVINIDGLQFQVKENKTGAREFVKLYGMVQQALLHGPHANTAKVESSGSKSSGIADELQKLAALKDKKMLTEKEYQTAKQQLLKDN